MRPGWPAAGGLSGANFLGHVLVIHSGEIVEAFIVLAHMSETEMMKLTLGFFPFWRPLVAWLVAPFPLAYGPLWLVGGTLARFYADRIKKVGTQRSNPDIGC